MLQIKNVLSFFFLCLCTTQSGDFSRWRAANHKRNSTTHTHKHTPVRHALNVLVRVFCVPGCVFFPFLLCHHLIRFLSVGTQTRRLLHRHHPCLDILEPPESDVLILACGRSKTKGDDDGGGCLRTKSVLYCFSRCVCINLQYVLFLVIH